MKLQAVFFTPVLFCAALLAIGSCKKDAIQCPEGYGGDDCATELTPQKVRITGITLTKFPATNPLGMAWDEGFPQPYDNPDIILAIGLDTTIIWSSQQVYQDAIPGMEIYSSAASATGPIDLDPNKTYAMLAFERDTEYEFMGGVSGKFYTSGAGFPTQLILSCGTCEVAFEIEVKYIH